MCVELVTSSTTLSRAQSCWSDWSGLLVSSVSSELLAFSSPAWGSVLLQVTVSVMSDVWTTAGLTSSELSATPLSSLGRLRENHVRYHLTSLTSCLASIFLFNYNMRQSSKTASR